MIRTTIYTFHKYDNSGNIHISALSFIEAINAIYELNNCARFIYNFEKFSKYVIATNDYCRILNIEPEYTLFPRFISDEEYVKLFNYFIRVNKKKTVNDTLNIQNANSCLFGTEHKNMPSIFAKQEKDYSEGEDLNNK